MTRPHRQVLRPIPRPSSGHDPAKPVTPRPSRLDQPPPPPVGRCPGRAGWGVAENGWFWTRPARQWKPRLKASFQRLSPRGISEQAIEARDSHDGFDSIACPGQGWTSSAASTSMHTERLIRPRRSPARYSSPRPPRPTGQPGQGSRTLSDRGTLNEPLARQLPIRRSQLPIRRPRGQYNRTGACTFL